MSTIVHHAPFSRWRDQLGRLQGATLQNLQANQVPQILAGQITGRQYHYDSLSKLTAIEMPNQTQRYGHDPTGRLKTIRWVVCRLAERQQNPT